MQKGMKLINYCLCTLALIILHATASANTLQEVKQAMYDTVVKQEKRFVIGIPIRTSNENGRFQREVPPLWDKFYRENLAQKIPNKVNQNLLAVYTDYEGDYTKPFTYMIGCEVSNLSTIPEGMRGIELEPSSYAVFTAKGAFPQSMMQAWQSIWTSIVKRSYTTDFEVYKPDFNPQDNPEIRIFIATAK